MFRTGDFVIYGSHGVCEVASVGPMNMAGTIKDRLYYTLSSVYSPGSTVYTPVDNEKVIMRPIASKKEALDLVQRIPDIEALWLGDEKSREKEYKAAINSCKCTDLIKIIKTLYLRKKSRLGDGKKVTTVDEKYLRLAEDLFYGEMAIPLQMERAEVLHYIMDCVGSKEQVIQ